MREAGEMRREAPIQRAIVQWLRAQHPAWIVHHNKNEINKRGKAIALELAQAKQAGAITGWPDLIVLPPSHVGPIFFEVKAEGNYPTDAQRRVHDQLRALGYRVGIVRSVDDVKERLADWGIWFSRGAA
jgi:hypothetical protein